MADHPCITCGSTDNPILIGLCIDWPALDRARLDASHGCAVCGTKEDLEGLTAVLNNRFSTHLTRLERHLASGNCRAIDRCTDKLMRAIAKALPDLAAAAA